MRFRVLGYHLRSGGKRLAPGSIVELDEGVARRLGAARLELVHESTNNGEACAVSAGAAQAVVESDPGVGAVTRASVTAPAPLSKTKGKSKAKAKD